MAVVAYPRTRWDEWYALRVEKEGELPKWVYVPDSRPETLAAAERLTALPPTRPEDRECWAKKVAEAKPGGMVEVPYDLLAKRLMSVEDVKPVPDGETAEVWDRMENVVSDIQNGRLQKQGRMRLRGALDRAEAPPTGRAAADAGLGRALRKWGGA